ncbi:MAG: sensor histidine kinase [Nocardiopsaceae bacterium]|nr:sensor histidine kinase [Nocardiopsaceae bacterium]
MGAEDHRGTAGNEHGRTDATGTDMRRTRRDPGRWVAFDGAHPPRVLTILFWTAAATNSITILHGLQTLSFLADPVVGLFYLTSGAALPAACLLWPLLVWQAPAPRPRKAATVLFLVCAAFLVVGGGGAPVFVLTSLAVGNAVTVLGPRAAITFAAVISAAGFVLHAFDHTHTAWQGLFEAATLLSLCLGVTVAFRALLAARDQAAATRRLLAALEDAHEELRRYADQARELAVAHERARMAREMHDSVGHYLTVINMDLANAQRFRTARPEAAWEEVRDAQRLTREALADTRRWVRALKPLRLEGRAGIAAMRALAESFAGTGTDVGFTAEGTWPDTGEETELVCYRALQEGLTNALRHSAAGRVEAAVVCTGESITVYVADDGRGCGPDAVGTGFGLRGLRERVEAAGGTLLAGPREEGGFELRVCVPWRSAHPAAPTAEPVAL